MEGSFPSHGIYLDEGDTEVKVGSIAHPQCEGKEASNGDNGLQICLLGQVCRRNHACPDLRVTAKRHQPCDASCSLPELHSAVTQLMRVAGS